MPICTVTIVGVYEVPRTEELFRRAMGLKYGGIQLSPREREEAEAAVRAEFASVVLIECQVVGADTQFDVGDFSRPDSDQAPYDEAFLSGDGNTMLPSGDSKPSTSDFRVCFFLHYYDPNKPLSTSHGTFLLPPTSAMPDRLRALIEYEPVT